ncbi:GNAT family N-acetyltransferase [Undibacterium sp.]|uniref:GNAT family N-acetyltransferase n=1 Tax=Undibacterium sp. TaxID=1914977 RepID=UPI00374DD719
MNLTSNPTVTDNSDVLHYRMRILSSMADIGQTQWDGLLASQQEANPFLSYAFLDALHASGSASKKTGWRPVFLTLWDGDQLAAAMPLYEKSHSYGEYVFDWAWADAYQRHGLEYYPKLLSAIPFTPVSGVRLLASDQLARDTLLQALCKLQESSGISSTHILFPTEAEAGQLSEAGFLLRTGVQFHWLNHGYQDFEHFLSTLEQKKRKNIRAERRKVFDAEVSFRHVAGADLTEDDWRFFKRCYDHTYSEHHSTPYLNLDFFLRIGQTMPENIHLIFAQKNGKPIASSLLIHTQKTVYGRYWGALEYIPCLHFETAYYQPLEFCIAEGIQVFEGGAQGEHKMARGFLPQKTFSAHWLAQPEFSDAVAVFLQREAGGMEDYISELNERAPYRNKQQDAHKISGK